MSGDGDDDFLLSGIPPEELEPFLEWRGRVRGTNISEKTLLATDYLNHFNEIVMLLEMVPDMPDILEECFLWEPKSYVEHFAASGFADKELAIAAYDSVPSKFREPLEDLVEQLQIVVAYTLQKLWLNREEHPDQETPIDVSQAVSVLHSITQAINGIIHGTAETMVQEDIDHYLGAG